MLLFLVDKWSPSRFMVRLHCRMLRSNQQQCRVGAAHRVLLDASPAGVTLSEKEPIAQFDVPDIPEEYIIHSHKLIIKQISLGSEAKSGEFNVIQAETNVNEGGEKKTVKIPIAVLKVGETRNLRPNVEFPNGSVTFKLVQGTGPVYVCGKTEMNFGEFDDGQIYEEYSDEEEDSELEFDQEAPHTNGKSNKKK